MAVNEGTGPGEGYGVVGGGDAALDRAEREPLPCGRELWSVWERHETGEPDPHADGCPHCTEALTSLRRLEDVVSTARDAEPAEAEPDASALVGRVMDVVRLELRPGRTLPLGEDDEDAWIVEAAAARVVRAAAETLPGVRAGSCRIEGVPGQGPGAASGQAVPRGPVVIRLAVEVALTRGLQEVADRVRRRVLEAAESELGMRVVAVDVTIADIIDEREERA
ncbi:Asp23/Gls24 family envelope stress response protein [Streptomyces sp. A1499]|uniref:Asp23/Gls24 family envelope stress response protein n=1 Tax=Streptomyces sp. A1499 TaxID=2563104 RepID=UPI001F0D3692|nr:Asp23/Gls24 family envelope stress response protein [Streptomyces sp. A1499]